MYLSKKDYDFLTHLHDDVFAKKIRVSFDGNTAREMPLAVFMDVEDYVYYINMMKRFNEERHRANEKTREIVAQRRKFDKNYARPKK